MSNVKVCIPRKAFESGFRKTLSDLQKCYDPCGLGQISFDEDGKKDEGSIYYKDYASTVLKVDLKKFVSNMIDDFKEFMVQLNGEECFILINEVHPDPVVEKKFGRVLSKDYCDVVDEYNKIKSTKESDCFTFNSDMINIVYDSNILIKDFIINDLQFYCDHFNIEGPTCFDGWMEKIDIAKSVFRKIIDIDDDGYQNFVKEATLRLYIKTNELLINTNSFMVSYSGGYFLNFYNDKAKFSIHEIKAYNAFCLSIFLQSIEFIRRVKSSYLDSVILIGNDIKFKTKNIFGVMGVEEEEIGEIYFISCGNEVIVHTKYIVEENFSFVFNANSKFFDIIYATLKHIQKKNNYEFLKIV